jgi:hypothetical protein
MPQGTSRGSPRVSSTSLDLLQKSNLSLDGDRFGHFLARIAAPPIKGPIKGEVGVKAPGGGAEGQQAKDNRFVGVPWFRFSLNPP